MGCVCARVCERERESMCASAVWGRGLGGKREKKCCNFYSEFQLDNQNQLALSLKHTHQS